MAILSNGKLKQYFSMIQTLLFSLIDNSIVFSSWVKMLYLVGLALKDANINALQYTGMLSVSEKQKVLNDFKSNPRVIVLLMSIGSGGVG